MATFDFHAGLVSPYISAPLSQITPFTYRDGATYLEKLNALCKWIEYVKETLQENIDAVAAADEAALEALTAQLNTVLLDFVREWQATLAGLEDQKGDMARDPTTGLLTPLNQVIGHVYDNTRYYAYFADQLDDFELTALEWDTLEANARHFDLMIAYSPTNANGDDILPAPVQPN